MTALSRGLDGVGGKNMQINVTQGNTSHTKFMRRAAEILREILDDAKAEDWASKKRYDEVAVGGAWHLPEMRHVMMALSNSNIAKPKMWLRVAEFKHQSG
jgi:hypothetical protein